MSDSNVDRTAESPTSYGRRLTELAAERPDDVDVIIVGRDGAERGVDWRTLETRANQIARELARRGVAEGDIVALALPTCLEHIFVTLAIWKLGATLLPLRHDLPEWEFERMLALARPAVLVSETPRGAAPTLTVADLDATSGDSAEALEDHVSECVNLIASSGSTGSPKLIVVPARGVVGGDAHATATRGSAQLTALVCSPLYHVNGFNYAAPLALEGGRAIVMEKFDAPLALELIERHQATFTVMVPTMLQRLARLDELTSTKVASLQRLIYGGAKVPDWVVDRWLEVMDASVFTFVYGSSERLGYVSMTGDDWAAHRGSTGRPQDVELSIRDAEGRPLPTGEIGEIYMRPLTSRPLFRYIGAEAPAPTDDGFSTIGDLGWLDAEGYLYVADRRSDMIITGGVNVFPAEVEEAISGHPQVVDQVVVGVPDPDWGHRVHAIVQPRDPASPPPLADLQAFCRARLAPYKVPKTWEIVDIVPRSEAGKLNRNALGEARASDAGDARHER